MYILTPQEITINYIRSIIRDIESNTELKDKIDATTLKKAIKIIIESEGH